MRRCRRTVVVLVAAAAGVLAVASPSSAAAADGTRVQMVDNEPDLTRWHFDPAQLTVPAGSSVVWFNKGKEDHSVTADDKSFDSGLKKSGASWQRSFPRPGTFAYHCEPHPWMTGTIQVVAAPTTTTAAPSATGSAPPGSATLPPSPATQPPAQAPETTTSAASPATEPSSDSGDSTAAAAASGKRSGGHLAGTIALVLGPTLAGLVLGAKLRRRRS